MDANSGTKVPATTLGYLNTTWLDDSSGGDSIASANLTATSFYGNSLYVTPTYYWGGYYTTREKIRLTLSDVEHLRKCAREDKKLKAALQKIAPHIEVEVDF